jgi:hypothetical protein
MTRLLTRRARTQAALALLALSVGLTGCGTAASPSPSPTPTPTIAPTAAPTPTPAPTPSPAPTATPAATSPAASVDPSADLSITAPYALEPLDRITEAAVQAAMSQALGSFASIVQFGFRQAVQDGKPVCIVMVMQFPGAGTVGAPGFLDSLAAGLKGSSGTTTETTVGGHPVRIVTNGTQAMGIYMRQEGVVIPICQTPADATAVVTALIGAEN